MNPESVGLLVKTVYPEGMVSAPTTEPWTWNLRMQNLNAYWFVSFCFVFVDLFSSIFISLKLHPLVLMAYLSVPVDTQMKIALNELQAIG